MTIWTELNNSYKNGSYLTRLLYINVAIFVIVGISSSLMKLANISTVWVSFLEMPASIYQFIHQPWSIITYMFLHTGLIHLIFNVLTLYWFGKIFLQYYSQKQLTSLYITGGIFGAIVYMAGFNLIPYFQSIVESSFILGASASVMSIIFASVITDPDKEIHLTFLGNIKLKYLGLIFLFLDLIGIGATNAGGSMAHIGGAAIGCIFALLIKKSGIDICTPINAIITFFAGLSLFNKDSFSFKKRPKMRVKPQGKATDAQWNEYNNETKSNNNARVDEILEKIKRSGYSSLTDDEKRDLFNMSKK